MKLDIGKILETVLEVGADAPAFVALFNQVVDAFQAEPDKQAELKEGYAEALAKAKAQHEDAQKV